MRHVDPAYGIVEHIFCPVCGYQTMQMLHPDQVVRKTEFKRGGAVIWQEHKEMGVRNGYPSTPEDRVDEIQKLCVDEAVRWAAVSLKGSDGVWHRVFVKGAPRGDVALNSLDRGA